MIKRWFGAAIATAIAVAIGLMAFQWFPWPQEIEFYYADPQATFLVPVTQKVAFPHSTLKAIPTVLEGLSHAPKGLTPLVSKQSNPKLSLQDRTANVTLQTATYGGGLEQLMASALTKSLCQLPGIQQVGLTLSDSQGNPLESEHLDLSEPFRPDAPENENTWLTDGSPTKVYWATPDQHFLVPLQVSLTDAAKPIESTWEILLAGPRAIDCSQLAPSIPSGIKLTWLGLTEGIAHVGVENQKLPKPQWEITQRAIVLTLTEFRSIHGVQFQGSGLTPDVIRRPKWINHAL